MVNRETTNGIRVTAVSYYMGCKDNQQGKKYWVSGELKNNEICVCQMQDKDM